MKIIGKLALVIIIAFGAVELDKQYRVIQAEEAGTRCFDAGGTLMETAAEEMVCVDRGALIMEDDG